MNRKLVDLKHTFTFAVKVSEDLHKKIMSEGLDSFLQNAICYALALEELDILAKLNETDDTNEQCRKCMEFQ